MSPSDQAARQRFVSFTTFRRSGEAVATPVWIARDGDGLCFLSVDETGKVKRLRRDDRVTLRPCSRLGKVEPDAPTWTGTARVDRTPEAIARVRAAISAKYIEGRIGYLALRVLQRVGAVKSPRVAIVITLDD